VKLIKTFLFSLFLTTFLACTKTIEGDPYTGHGISLMIPKGWKQKEAPIPEVGMFITVEKEGDDESGIFSIGVLDEKVSINEQMNMMKERMQQSMSISGVTVNYTATKSETFNGIKTLSCTFDYTNEALSFDGELRAFHCGEKTIYILIQEEAGDKARNAEGLHILNSSFNCTS